MPSDARSQTVPSEQSGVGVTVSTKLLYGVGEIPITVTMVLFGLFVLFFYNSVMKLPAVLVGLAGAAGLLWDAIIDPYIGYRSDHSSHRLGKRHAFMLLGALTMGLAFWLLLSPPRGLGRTGLFAWLLTTTVIFRFTSALYRIPYLGLGAELSQDYHERTSIVGIRSFFGLVGTLAAATLSFVLFFPNREPGIDPKMDYFGYPAMGLTFGIIMTATGLLAVAGTASRRLTQDSRQSPLHDSKRFWRGFSTAMSNAAFRSVWLSFSLFFLAVVMNAVVSIHFFTWYVGITDSTVLSRFQLCFYVGALAGVAFWVTVSKRVEKRLVYFTSMFATAALMVAATLFLGEGRLFGTGNPGPLFAGYSLAGFFASALWVLPGSMIADVADQDELATGLRREGIFFGILNFGEKIAAGLSLLISGAVIEYFVHLKPGALEQPAQATHRIGILYGVLPAILIGSAAFILSGYRLDRDKILDIQTELEKRRIFRHERNGSAAEGAASEAGGEKHDRRG